MAKEIIIKCSDVFYTVVVDDEDYPILSRHNWHLLPTKSGIYAYASLHMGGNVRKMTSMTQMIMGSGSNIDHIDRNTLNNQKSNLRAATYQQNGWNTAKRNRTAGGGPPTSQYKGVSKCIGAGGRIYWRVIIKLTKKGETPAKFVRLGTFDTEVEAARAYNKEIVKHRGEFAYLNELPS